MKNYSILLIILTILIGCKDSGKEIIYDFNISLAGDTDSYYANTGEEREYYLSVTSTPQLTKDEIETRMRSWDINITSLNNVFQVSDKEIKENEILFSISSEVNKTADHLEDKINIAISGDNVSKRLEFNLTQNPSHLSHEYIISSTTGSTFTIPQEGGSFSIPISCKKRTYLNEELLSENLSDLKGIHYVSKCLNAAWVHMDNITKVEEGEYLIELNASQPFNVDYPFSWYIELWDGDSLIYELEIFHEQTPGEEYYAMTVSRMHSRPLDI